MPHKIWSSAAIVFPAIICSAQTFQQSIGCYIHVFGEYVHTSHVHTLTLTHIHTEIQFNIGV